MDSLADARWADVLMTVVVLVIFMLALIGVIVLTRAGWIMWDEWKEKQQRGR